MTTCRSALAIAVLVSLGWTLSCSAPSPEGALFGDQEVESGDAGDTISVDLGDSTASAVSTVTGTWLAYGQTSTCVNLIGTDEALTRRLYIVETTERDNHTLLETWNICEIDLSPVFGFQTIIPPAILETSYPVVTTDGMVTGSDVDRLYISGLLAETWGLDFDDPATDPFPESADDPAISDTDGDGMPGATILVGTMCETYHTQRTISVYDGVFVAPDRIEGNILSILESLTVDATQPICGTDYAQRPNEARSMFARVRIDGRGGSLDLDANEDNVISCDEVLPYRDVLFERLEPDDDLCLGF